MLVRALATMALVLALASPAQAGSKTIVTPGLKPPSDGALGCRVVNASSSKPISITMAFRSADGGALKISLFPIVIPPFGSYSSSESQDDASHCTVGMKSGNSKDARVTVWVEDSGGDPIAAAAAHSK